MSRVEHIGRATLHLGDCRDWLNELIDVWEIQAAEDRNESPLRRETLRECADTIRMLLQLDTPEDCPHAAPFRYCSVCVVSPCPVGLGANK